MGEYRINEDGTVTRFVLPEELKGRPLLSDLNFSHQELLAIAKVGLMMAASDGNIAPEERNSVAAEIMQISSGNSVEQLIKECVSFSYENAESIISRMSYKQKQYVTAFLITIMVADRNLHAGERLFLGILTQKCKLPQMSTAEANNIMINL